MRPQASTPDFACRIAASLAVALVGGCGSNHVDSPDRLEAESRQRAAEQDVLEARKTRHKEAEKTEGRAAELARFYAGAGEEPDALPDNPLENAPHEPPGGTGSSDSPVPTGN